MKLTAKEIAHLAKNCGMAPSGGNVQPWRLVFDGSTMCVYLDPLRSDSFIDVERYASLFALGCLLENALITLRSMGVVHKVMYNGYRGLDKPVARIELSGRKGRSSFKEDPLYKSIPDRCTNRQIHDGTILSDNVIKELRKNIKGFKYRYTLSCVSKYGSKKSISKVLGVADGIRNTNRKALDQLIREFRWTKSEVKRSRDGIDLETCELPGHLEKMLKLIKKAPNMTKVVPRQALEKMAEPILIGCSHLCSLNTEDKLTYNSMFYAGQAMQRIWLSATKSGLAIQPWSIVPFFLIRVNIFDGAGFNIREIRDIKEMEQGIKKEFGLTNKETPLFIFRLSKAKPPSARSLRLRWIDYTEIIG